MSINNKKKKVNFLFIHNFSLDILHNLEKSVFSKTELIPLVYLNTNTYSYTLGAKTFASRKIREILDFASINFRETKIEFFAS